MAWQQQNVELAQLMATAAAAEQALGAGEVLVAAAMFPRACTQPKTPVSLDAVQAAA